MPALVAGSHVFRAADTELRLARYYGVSDGFFIGLQTDYKLMECKSAISAKLKAIRPPAA